MKDPRSEFVRLVTKAMQRSGFIVHTEIIPLNQEAVVIPCSKGGEETVTVAASGMELRMNSEPKQIEALATSRTLKALEVWTEHNPEPQPLPTVNRQSVDSPKENHHG